ncbi:MAG: TonB-dependent receptor [Gemmatimonadaceae bacterium]|jgi:iron complex outermembrane receptor protein
MRLSRRGTSRSLTIVALLSLSLGASASGQSGTVRGTVKSRGQVLPSVRIYALTANAIRGEARTDESGSYRLQLPPGEYALVFRLPGYAQRRVDGVQIGATSETAVDAELDVQPVELNKVVVSAGRRSERLLDVAAAVNVVDEAAIQRRVATSPLDYVMSVPGVDFAVQGLQGRQMVGRGFNGTFGPSLLLLSDYRNAALPSVRASLSYFLTPNGDDIDRIEVIRGPASALYGSNAADGVVHFITKSPFDSPGTDLSLTGGDRSLFQGTARYAAVVNDRLAFKFSGTYFRGREWEAPPQPSEVQARDPITERLNSEFRADYRFSKGAAAVLTLGTTVALRNVDYTTIGTYQLDHSRADFAQLRFSSGALFAQVYVNTADSPAGATVNLQTRQTAVDHSNVIVGQVQNGFDIGQTNITYGVDIQRTDPRTEGTVYGRNESDDRSIETGVFAQALAKLSPKLQLVGAARVDDHSRTKGAVFSPRLAFVFTPRTGQRFRVGYNRAFSTPTPGNLFLDVVAARLDPLPFTIRAVGVPVGGFSFPRDCGGLCMTSPFVPGQRLPVDATLLWPAVVQILKASGVDISALPAPRGTDVSTVLRSLDLRNGSFVAAGGTVNDIGALLPTITNSFEAGYKGLVGQRLVFDGSVYATRRKNFIAPLSVGTPNVFFSTPSLAAYLGRFLPAAQAGELAAAIGGVDGNSKAPGIPLATISPTGPLSGTDILLTYRNVGDVKLWGADLSAEYFANDNLSFSGSYSWVSDNLFPSTRAGEADLSTNAPRNKALLSARAHRGAHDVSFELRGRYVGGFRMVDGVWNGHVDAFTVGDVETGFAIPGTRDARFTLTVQNVADNRHSEFLSAPILGRMLLARVQYRR